MAIPGFVVSDSAAAMTDLRKEARGRECQIRLPGVCNFRNETSVLCHLNGAGLAIKQDDIHAAIGCSDCHDAIDGRKNYGFDHEFLEAALLWGMFRTQKIWVDEGFIVVV